MKAEQLSLEQTIFSDEAAIATDLRYPLNIARIYQAATLGDLTGKWTQ